MVYRAPPMSLTPDRPNPACLAEFPIRVVKGTVGVGKLNRGLRLFPGEV